MTTRPLFSTTLPTIAPLDNRVRGYPSVSTISPAEDLARPSDRPVETIRRAISMPTHLSSQPGKAYPSSLSLSPTSNPKILLPLSYNTSQPSRFPSFRSTSRRLSYNLKMRASRHAVPLTFFSLVTMLVFFFTYSRHSAGSVGFLNSHTNGGKLHIYTRDQLPLGGKAKGKSTKSHTGNSGVSRLEQDEEELIAEDDLFWSSYVEPTPKTEEEKLAEKEIADHRLEVQEYDRQHSLRALVWWLAEGGMFPTNYKAPSKAELRKLGGRGTELLLDKIDRATDEDTVFQDGWSQYAKKQYRIVVFSKSYCPFSRKAKSILDNYHLSPSPFVVELDQRTDMAVIQNILQSLTGRRTVPNILLDFHSVGGSDELSLSHSEGGLHRKFEEMGVLPGSARRRPPKVGVVPVPEGVALADGAGVGRPVHANAPPVAPVIEQVAGGIPPPDLDQAGEAALDRHPAGGVPPVQEEAVLEGDHGVDPRPKAISPGEKPKDNPIDNAGERHYARDLIQETEDVAAPYEESSTNQTPDEEVAVKRAAPVPRNKDVENEHHFQKAAEPRQKQRNGAAALAAAGNGRRRKGSVL